MRARHIKKLARKLKHEPQDALGFNTRMVVDDGRRLGRRERAQVAHINAVWRDVQREAFREACLNVLGEDPDDWNLTAEEYDAKYAPAPTSKDEATHE